MTPRLDPFALAPRPMQAMLELESRIRAAGLEPGLLHLVKFRASQINGCAYCLDMHSREARADGEREERLHLLAAWREAPLYSPRERAALAWTEAVTCIAETAAPDADYEAARAQFSEEELVALTLAITTINAWNRLAIAFRKVPEAAASAPA